MSPRRCSRGHVGWSKRVVKSRLRHDEPYYYVVWLCMECEQLRSQARHARNRANAVLSRHPSAGLAQTD